MVVYTDGITEAMNSAGMAYGIERLSQAVKYNHSKPSRAIQEGILESLRAYVGAQNLADDVSFLIIKPA
jgi:serine phosphatase RsbU (regulator of sigma subunit)